MVFIGFGYGLSFTGLFPHSNAEAVLHLVAEVALIVLLFLDAAQIRLSALRERHVWPVRMLVFGLPLSIALGTFAAWLFLPQWPLFALALPASVAAQPFNCLPTCDVDDGRFLVIAAGDEFRTMSDPTLDLTFVIPAGTTYN